MRRVHSAKSMFRWWDGGNPSFFEATGVGSAARRHADDERDDGQGCVRRMEFCPTGGLAVYPVPGLSSRRGPLGRNLSGLGRVKVSGMADMQEQSIALSARLTKAGHPITEGQLLALIDGVNASPLAASDETWIALVGGSKDRELRAGLLTLRQARRRLCASSKTSDAAGRLAALRARLAELGVDGFVLPRADEHQGEYLPRRAERLAWLTDFTGSAGVAVVLKDKAAVFTDGRYSLAIREQVDASLYETWHVTNEPPAKWIEENLGAGGSLGYDPWLHTLDGLARLSAAAKAAGGALVALAENPLDSIWTDQPPAPITPVVPHDLGYAGRSIGEKRIAIAESLVNDAQDAVILSSPESIAWLLNIRGGDVPCTPLPLSFAILNREASVDLYLDERKLTPATREHLGNAVSVHPREALGPAIDVLVGNGRMLRVDPASSPAWIAQRIEAAGGTIARGDDPVVLPRALKNPVELAGTRIAHQRDGVAMVRFLHWFASAAPKGGLDELAAAEKLRAFRAEGALFKDLSFDTISGAGPNGAIVHYRVTEESNREIQPGDLYLVDSGAQYLDGTTDITRTIGVGDPGDEARDRFTRVLKGHIALATARFPVGTNGAQLDPLARKPLWHAGLDFDHGTGHGVGSYLGVHEGPQRISKAPSTVALRPGMIISNEPGYYKRGHFGIRLENLIVVQECEIAGGDRAMLSFETITLAPFDQSMVEVPLLDDDEIRWLDAYHGRVRATLSPMLEPEVAAWLAEATTMIG
jgi:Xaa-Pro aminopeptidase